VEEKKRIAIEKGKATRLRNKLLKESSGVQSVSDVRNPFLIPDPPGPLLSPSSASKFHNIKYMFQKKSGLPVSGAFKVRLNICLCVIFMKLFQSVIHFGGIGEANVIENAAVSDVMLKIEPLNYAFFLSLNICKINNVRERVQIL
jgi:predicted AlkP superfamily pyrophosphatase or phosphodiesterase